MTTEDTIILAEWQRQRAKKVSPEKRLDEKFERELEIIRQCLARTK